MYPELHQWAMLTAAQAPAPGGCGGAEQPLLFVLMFAILYFVWLRPASREQKQHAQMLKALKRGDRVVTKSGIIGNIADRTEKTVTLEVAPKVKIEMLEGAVARRFSLEAEAEAKRDTKTAKKDGSEPAKKETAPAKKKS